MLMPWRRSWLSASRVPSKSSTMSVSVISSSSPLGVEARNRERAEHGFIEIAADELRRRQIDRELDVRRPAGGIPAGTAQHPVAEPSDQAGFLGDRDEFHRPHQSAHRMAPAQQGL